MGERSGEGRLSSYLRTGAFTTLNILVNALTLGRVLWLEGSVRGGVFRNWARRIASRPQRVEQAPSEAALRDLVLGARGVRCAAARRDVVRELRSGRPAPPLGRGFRRLRGARAPARSERPLREPVHAPALRPRRGERVTFPILLCHGIARFDFLSRARALAL